MRAEDLKVGNIIVETVSWVSHDYRFYRVKKETPKTVILDSLKVKYTYESRENYLNPNAEPTWVKKVSEIIDEVSFSFRVHKTTACSEYKLYDPNKKALRNIIYILYI